MRRASQTLVVRGRPPQAGVTSAAHAERSEIQQVGRGRAIGILTWWELDPAVRSYYERGKELDRLAGGNPAGPLELERTQELITRYLPPRPSTS